MHLSTYHDIIYRTINTDCPGYGYLEVFANTLHSHRENDDLNIGNVLLFLKLETNSNSTEFLYFVDERRFNTNCFKLTEIASQNRVIDSSREDMTPFKNTTELGGFHVIAFPVHPKASSEKLFTLKGVVMLLSQTEIKLSAIEQEQLYNMLCTQKPKTLECPQVGKAIKLLVSSEGKVCDISLKDRHVVLGQALDILANKGDEKKNIHGLRHFSFWSSNNIEKRYLCKEFNKNTYGDFLHDITHKVLDGQSHFIAEYFNFYKEHEGSSFKDVIQLFKYDDIESSLNNSKQYFPNIGLTRENTSVIVVPLNFDPHISFCCFYIKDIFYTPFVSITFFKKFCDAIRQRINLINEINIKNMLNEMMVASFTHPKSTDYFREISNILKKSNEAEDCLIYLKNDAGTHFLLASEEDENNTSTIHESNEQLEGFDCFLPGKIKSSGFIQDSIHLAIKNRTSICSYPENKDDKFKSVCVIIIKDADNSVCGFILLIDKSHKQTQSTGLYFNELFFYNNIYITESCSKFLLLYLSIMQSNNRKIRLLKKLRHEIPDCAHVIDKDITEISNRIEDRGYRINRFPRRVREILINSRRIDNIASFFSTIDFDDYRFLEFPHPFNLRDYMAERLDQFKEEASYRGVNVRCNTEIDTPTLEVSDYYLHAITNIITNAIRYAAPGTCIWIRSNSEEITISDIGIQIKDSEMDKIFKEGYRSVSAKDVNERGMGYGLYLVKRILDAYGHSIDVTCDKVEDRNLFAERMVSNIISEFTPEERKDYVLQDTYPQEEPEVWRRVNAIKKSESKILYKYHSFINRDNKSCQWWFDYHRKNGPTFFWMEDDYFCQAVYHVTFSIKLPK